MELYIFYWTKLISQILKSNEFIFSFSSSGSFLVQYGGKTMVELFVYHLVPKYLFGLILFAVSGDQFWLN